jgi:uncharacterized membrane protein
VEKLRAVWKNVVESLWFLPALLTLAGGTLAVLLVHYDEEIKGGLEADEEWWLFGGESGGAQSVLEAIAGSIVTVTGVVFSVTIIALQLASSQYTPRVLRQFMADRANQLVLGVFIGTFTYSILVLRTVRGGDDGFVPSVAVTGSLVLILTSLGFLIYFIDHLARSIQATMIIESVTDTTLDTLRSIFPDTIHEWSVPSGETADEVTPLPAGEAHEVHAVQAGYVQAVERRALRRLATEHGLVVRLEVEIGAFVLPGRVVMRAWPAAGITTGVEEQLRRGLVMGVERTPHQDLMHGIIEMMDIAVKALSPSINDPTTAVTVIQRQSQVLLDMAWRDCGPAVEKDDGGTIRVIVRRPDLADATGLAYNQIRHYGAENPTVVIALLETLGELAALSPEPARPAFTDQLHATISSARELMKNPPDQVRLEQAIERALARAAEPAPRQRPHTA